jgi:uncharacterized protein (TIGR02246 family)
MRKLFHPLPGVCPMPLLGFLLLFALGTTPLGAASSKEAAVEIRAVMDAQQAAWNRRDLEGFMQGYARSGKTVFVSGDTVTRGWQTVLDRYKKKYANADQMGQLRFSDVEVTLLSADAAVVLGRWELKRKDDKPHGRFTLIFRRLPEGWRIIHDHTSAATP